MDLSLAFMAGILGSGHCLGMCGSLVSAFFSRFAKGLRGWMPYMAYHGGRVTIYLITGLLAGLLGLALTSTGIIGKAQGILQIVVGLLVIILGFELLGLPWLRLKYNFWPFNRLQSLFGQLSAYGPVRGALTGGVLNGLMPCSLTLAMAVKATTAGGALQGGALMLAFGAGTLPAMLFVSLAFHKLGVKLRGWLLKIAGLFVIAMGVSTLWQGLTFFSIMRHLPNW
uniref:Urease accessory protein UreH-like transmembrane domain-containing protein n=1 Tax=Magnetococcus massalia (strain MO-1) TaxID=451514 RepID=A0A1S7LMA2_MAGMO|nr:Conserved membrane protein of unknown function [Candidatus Magnetococcus massalia]